MASMLAQIARGVKKSDSHLVTDAESSRDWDAVAADHKKLMDKNPRGHLEIPNDPDVF
jgi:hypothetical protein